ncbi:MAG: prepilin peptidase [Micrococcales bacterium]
MFSPALLSICYLLAVAWPLAKIDIREHRLPNKLVLPSFAVTLAGQLAAVLVGESWMKIVHALAVALLVFACGLVMNRWAGLGMGDVKLLAAMAFSLGWFSSSAVFYCVFIALVLAGLFVLVRRKFRNQSIALGPFLIAGFLLSSISIWQ